MHSQREPTPCTGELTKRTAALKVQVMKRELRAKRWVLRELERMERGRSAADRHVCWDKVSLEPNDMDTAQTGTS